MHAEIGFACCCLKITGFTTSINVEAWDSLSSPSMKSFTLSYEWVYRSELSSTIVSWGLLTHRS